MVRGAVRFMVALVSWVVVEFGSACIPDPCKGVGEGELSVLFLNHKKNIIKELIRNL